MGLLCFFLGISSLWNLNFGLELNIALKNLKAKCCKELRIWDAVCIHCTCLCKSPENSDFIIFSFDRDKKFVVDKNKSRNMEYFGGSGGVCVSCMPLYFLFCVFNAYHAVQFNLWSDHRHRA